MPSFAELDRLDTDTLRERAFARARERGDLGFFWDLLRHLPASAALASEDGSGGGMTATVDELIVAVEEMFGAGLGDVEPLFRARFIDYLERPAG